MNTLPRIWLGIGRRSIPCPKTAFLGVPSGIANSASGRAREFVALRAVSGLAEVPLAEFRQRRCRV